MRKLGVHHMSALEVSPVDFVDIAAKAGCAEISVFVEDSRNQFPVVTAAGAVEFKQRMRDAGIGVANIEAFFIAPTTDVKTFRAGLELGVALGARRAMTQLFDPEPQRVIDNLGRVCEMADELGLQVGIEFMALKPIWNSIHLAARLVAQVNKPNFGIGVDILHLVRSGGTVMDVADVAAMAPELIVHAQLCDSNDLRATSDYMEEAVGNRLAPGEGRFPIIDFLKALPATASLELEVPQPRIIPAAERIKKAVVATRKQLAMLD